MMLRKSIFIIFLFVTVSGASQKIPDSLLSKSYEELRNSYWEVYPDSLKGSEYVKTYLFKAKKDHDTIKIARGYQWFKFISSKYDDLDYYSIYNDSIISITKNIKNHNVYPAIAYHYKGIFLYNKGDLEEALNNFLIAKNHVEKNNNTPLFFSVKQAIAALKSKIGLEEEALKIYQEQLKEIRNFKSSDIDKVNQIDYLDDYIITLSNISLTYIRLKKIDLADIYIKKGINESLKFNDSIHNDSIYYYGFVSASAYNEYFKGNYKAAIDSLDKAFPHETDQNSRINHYLYKGRIAKDLNNTEEAILNFEKLDSIYEIHQDPVLELPEVYQTFIDYYKEKGDIENQLKYIDKFITVDSVLDANFNYLSTNITKEYDIPLLVSEKENLISQLEKEKNQSNTGLGILAGVSLLLGGFLFYYYKKQRFYKKRFEEILNTEPTKVSFLRRQESKKVHDLSKDVVEKITKGLKEFEREKDFLDHSTTLNSLSKKLDTNSNYLSKVINSYEQKNFSNYLNDLRVEYAIEQLKTNKQFRLYSVKGMAKEVGFNSPESFSKAFHKRTGIYPSYFLKQLEKISSP
ncbi:helix-turn-helix domain-containing protein [Flavobacteriaceae bacterium R38]|nr:helix-turn-helix domain-containing protein [Flavobacteriaceae bacterium R38]